MCMSHSKTGSPRGLRNIHTSTLCGVQTVIITQPSRVLALGLDEWMKLEASYPQFVQSTRSTLEQQAATTSALLEHMRGLVNGSSESIPRVIADFIKNGAFDMVRVFRYRPTSVRNRQVHSPSTPDNGTEFILAIFVMHQLCHSNDFGLL
jgi:hypothetical protein